MTLTDMADFICARVGRTDDQSKTRCKDFLKHRHRLIYDSYSWKDSMDVWSVPMPPDGRLKLIKVTDGGSGYTSSPTVTITGGGGKDAVATVKLHDDKVWKVEVTEPGLYYTSNPTITFSGGGGSGAAAQAAVYAGQGEVILPYDIGRVTAVRYAELSLDPVQLPLEMFLNSNNYDVTGTPVRWAEVAPVGLPWYPSQNDPDDSDSFKLWFQNNDALDDTKLIQIKGSKRGEFVEETVALTTAGVATTNEFYHVYSITKPETVDYVTVGRAPTGGADNFRLESWMTSSRFPRIRLIPQPDYSFAAAKQLVVVGKKRCRDLVSDQDEPQVRDIDEALIAYATGDMLELQRQYGKAQLKYQEAGAAMAVARDLETVQSGSGAYIIPEMVTAGDWNRDDFGF